MRITKIVFCAFLTVILTFGALNIVPVNAQVPEFAVTHVFWGDSTGSIQPEAGDKNMPLTITIRNIDDDNIFSFIGTLHLDGSPFTDTSGGTEAYSGISSTLSPGQSADLVFKLDIVPSAKLATYDLILEAHVRTPRYASGVDISKIFSVPFLGKVSFSLEQEPNVIAPGFNNFTVYFINTGDAQASSIDATFTIPPTLSRIDRDTRAAFSLIPPHGNASVTMTLFAPITSIDTAVQIPVTISYVDAYGFSRTDTNSVGLSVSPKITTPLMAVTSYAVAPDQIHHGEIFTVNADIENLGSSLAQAVNVQIFPPPHFASLSPTLLDLGDLAPGSVKNISYTVMVSPTATAGQTYTLEFDISYIDNQGQRQLSKTFAGIPVHGIIELATFDVAVSPTPAPAGRKFTVSLTVLNSGTIPAMFTNASLIPQYPFTLTSDSQSYLGQIDPNAPVPITLSGIIDQGAADGSYELTVQFLFKDEYQNKNTVLTKIPVKVSVTESVETSQGSALAPLGLPENAWLAVIPIILACVIAIILVRRRKHPSLSVKGN